MCYPTSVPVNDLASTAPQQKAQGTKEPDDDSYIHSAIMIPWNKPPTIKQAEPSYDTERQPQQTTLSHNPVKIGIAINLDGAPSLMTRFLGQQIFKTTELLVEHLI